MSLLRALARLAALSAATLGLAAVLAASQLIRHLRRRPPESSLGQRCVTAWARAALWILGVRWQIAGRLPVRGPCLIASNHLGYLDFFLHAAAQPSSFIAMRELSRWPVIGRLARWTETIFIDRADRADSARVCEQLRAHFDGGGMVTFFPEARTSPGRSVARFHAALFGAALGQGPHRPAIDVLPAAIHLSLGADQKPGPRLKASEVLCWCGGVPFLPHLLRLASLRHVRARLAFGEPVRAEGQGAAQRIDLANAVQARVCALFEPID